MMYMCDYQTKYNNMAKELADLKDSIKSYPRGSLRRRVIKERLYYYLQYREGNHVRSRYVKPDEVDKLLSDIEIRKELEKKEQLLEKRLLRYSELIGIHRSYRPVRNVDYEGYTLFMSTVAHDHKTMSPDDFLDKYDVSKYRGLNKRYLAGFLDYINDIDRHSVRKTNDLVLDPYTYLMYFKYGQKDILNEELKKAIPAFLNRGLLITTVQEAVHSAFDQ